MKILLVMIGGFFGAICRYTLGDWIHMEYGFPFGTLLVNLSGCFLLGWFLTAMSRSKKVRPEWTLLIGTGMIGSFTTFSTFSVETIQLYESDHGLLALLYILLSLIGGLFLTYLGYKLAVSIKKEGDGF